VLLQAWDGRKDSLEPLAIAVQERIRGRLFTDQSALEEFAQDVPRFGHRKAP
jgi:hypothetical protein